MWYTIHMPIPFKFDFKNPDYRTVFQWRLKRLEKIRANPKILPNLKLFYKNNPAQFIIDWGCTSDPRNAERGLPTVVPFLLFEKQEEWCHWFLDRWKNREPGITEKSREMGLSWLTVALASTTCLFNEGIIAGFGSRKEEYVDKIGDPKSLFFKARQFLSLLPTEFSGAWSSAHMKIQLHNTQSVMTGEAGDNIGRGNRSSFYFVDESAWLQRPELVEASLSETTNCRQDISTPKGMNNPFARKRFGGNIKVFTFHWRDDPRKDDAWYQKKCKDIDDPVVIAQEIDLDYSASVEGVMIPAVWVRSAIDAHIKLGVDPTGIKKAALDVADEGKDLNAVVGRHGVVIDHISKWSGKNSDIYSTVEKSLKICSTSGYNELDYDADGVGAGVKGDAKKIKKDLGIKVKVTPFKGGGAVVNPDQEMIEGRLNKDIFTNLKAQGWWMLRKRFQATYRAVVEELDFDPDEIISISSQCGEYKRLVTELSQPTFSQNNAGKILVDKAPDGAKSPNCADATMMVFAPPRRIRSLIDALEEAKK